MIESLRTTQIAFFRFATPCGNSGGAETRYKKYPCKGSSKRKSYETICENIVSRYQILVSSLPRMTVFRHRRPKNEFMTGLAGQPSNKLIVTWLMIFRDTLLSILVFVNETYCLSTCFTALYLFYWLLVVHLAIFIATPVVSSRT